MRLFVYLPLLAAVPGIALADPLTFNAALDQARRSAPSIQAKSAGVDATRAARGAAGALPDPTLAIGVDSFPVSGPLAFEPGRDDFTMARVGVNQNIPNLAKRHAQQARADSDIKSAEADTAVEARNVEVATALAWINLAYAERRLAVLDDILVRIDQVVDSTPSAVAAGSARPAQTLAGKQAVATLRDRRSELVANIARARAMLARWTGDVAPEISGPIPDFPVNADVLRAGLDRNPTILIAGAQIGQADADVRLAEANRRSDFGVNLAYQRRDPRFGDYRNRGVHIYRAANVVGMEAPAPIGIDLDMRRDPVGDGGLGAPGRLFDPDIANQTGCCSPRGRIGGAEHVRTRCVPDDPLGDLFGRAPCRAIGMKRRLNCARAHRHAIFGEARVMAQMFGLLPRTVIDFGLGDES